MEIAKNTPLLFGLLPLLVLSDSFAVGLVLSIAFLFCYIVTTVFLLFGKENRPRAAAALLLFFIVSICLSMILSITRIISPFLFEMVFLKICIIPLVPVLFNIQFSLNPKDHEWGLKELLHGLFFAFIILFTGFFREFLVSFSFIEIFRPNGKAIPVLPVFNQPAGALILLGLAIGLVRLIGIKIGKNNE